MSERLTRELRERADRLEGHPISLDDVKRSATRIKWQQRAATGAVAAVVLAVGIPVGMSVTDGGTSRDDGNRNIATNTPSGEPSPSRGVQGTVRLTLDDAAAGEAAQLTWLRGRTLHLSGGGTTELPKQYGAVAAYQDGYLGYDLATGTVDEIRGGEVVASRAGSGFAVSDDGSQVAWFEGDGKSDGQLKLASADGSGEIETVDVPAGSVATPVAFRGAGTVVYELSELRGGEQTVWWTEFDGRSHQVEGALAVSGYSFSQDRLAVMTQSNDTGSCSALYSFPGGESAGGLSQETCDFSLGEFSPDGSLVIGWPAYLSGWGPGQVAILDGETLQPIAEFDSMKDFGVFDAEWESDSALVANYYEEGRWQLLRLSVDGSYETASERVDADDMSNPFWLLSRR